jgi:hypothetical protein
MDGSAFDAFSARRAAGQVVRPDIREAQELALLLGNAAIAPVHPFEGGGDEKRGGSELLDAIGF